VTLLLTTDDTTRLVTTRECIDVLEQAYQALARGDATHRVRSDMVVPMLSESGQNGPIYDRSYVLATMEGAIRPLGVASIRLRSDHHQAVIRHGATSSVKWAQQAGLFCGVVMLYSLHTAEPLAIIQDGHLQVMRVGATSALAGKYLARPDSQVLGIIGAGNQALGHARAYATQFRLELVKVFSRTPAERERFAEELSVELGIPFRAVASAREVVEGSDIVAACTNSRTPVLEESWLAEGSYTSSVRYHNEIGYENVQRMDVHVVHPETYGPLYRAGTPEQWRTAPSAYPAGKPKIPDTAIRLADVVGGLHPGRTSPTQRTFFNNHAGMGIQFTALGKLVYDRATARGLGRELPTEWFLQDIST
jgi:ornithine cyclodeaminase/alanine dehydrogenase-like protein (mu-crystallin family)